MNNPYESPSTVRLKTLRYLPASLDDEGYVVLNVNETVSHFDRRGRRFLRSVGAISLRTVEQPDMRVGGLDKMQSATMLNESSEAVGEIGLVVHTNDRYGPVIASPIPDFATDWNNNLRVKFR